MNETDKRILSWGMEEKCLILHAEGIIVDVGKYTHLAFPPRRGIFIYPSEMIAYPEPLNAIRRTNIIEKRYCSRCPYKNDCEPDEAAVKNQKLWHSAVRPENQRK